MKQKWIIFLIGLSLMGQGMLSCSQEIRRVNFNLNTPLRVAILPFENKSSGDSYISKPFAAGINYLPLIGGDDQIAPASLMREKFSANLRSTNLNPILNTTVDIALTENKLYDIQTLKSMDLRRLEDMLDVDAVIFGEVTHWDRSYYVAESSVTIGLHVKMVDVTNNQLLWEHHFVDSERRGLTKVPTGYVSAGLEPLRGLSNSLFVELSDDVTRRVVDSIRPEKQSEFMDVTFPVIVNATFQIDSQKNEILVFAIGDENVSAFFSFGNTSEQIPMSEVSKGQYIGRYQFRTLEKHHQEKVVVRFVNKYGQRAAFFIAPSQQLSSKLSLEEVAFLTGQHTK